MLPARTTKGRLRAPFLLGICRAVECVFPFENCLYRANVRFRRVKPGIRISPAVTARAIQRRRIVPASQNFRLDHVRSIFPTLVSRGDPGGGDARPLLLFFWRQENIAGARLVGRGLSARRRLRRAVDARRRRARRRCFRWRSTPSASSPAAWSGTPRACSTAASRTGRRWCRRRDVAGSRPS